MDSFILQWEKETIKKLREFDRELSNYYSGLKEMYKGAYEEELPKTFEKEYRALRNLNNNIERRIKALKNKSRKIEKLIHKHASRI